MAEGDAHVHVHTPARRVLKKERDIDADQIGNLLTVALRAGVPGLVQDVLQHIVIPDGWSPLEHVMKAPFVDWVVCAWETTGSEAKGMLGHVIARCAVKSASA